MKGMVSMIAEPEVLATIKSRMIDGDKIAVYENHDLGSQDIGRKVFLFTGPTRTYFEPPKQAPDGSYGLGWRYKLIGFLDIETNSIERIGP